MGYEITYKYHPKLEEGVGYDHEVIEEKTVKVGKPFDDTPLEKCAAAIMGQLARRDIWVVDVEVDELVRKSVSFKESKDGKGIILKNRRFSLNQTAQLVAEDVVEVQPQQQMIVAPQPAPNGQQLQPHQMIQQPAPQPVAANTDVNSLYQNAGSLQTKRSVSARDIDQNTVLYHVYYEPYFHAAQAKAMKLKFTEDTKYPVHKVIPSATGKLDAQQIAVTDDAGQVMILDEKFFTSAGAGLVGDAELGFSEPRAAKRNKRAKLMYEDELIYDAPPADVAAQHGDIPVDDGSIPEELLATPDLRPGRQVM